MVRASHKQEYWEGQEKRRHPTDSIIAAFALSKAKLVIEDPDSVV